MSLWSNLRLGKLNGWVQVLRVVSGHFLIKERLNGGITRIHVLTISFGVAAQILQFRLEVKLALSGSWVSRSTADSVNPSMKLSQPAPATLLPLQEASSITVSASD